MLQACRTCAAAVAVGCGVLAVYVLCGSTCYHHFSNTLRAADKQRVWQAIGLYHVSQALFGVFVPGYVGKPHFNQFFSLIYLSCYLFNRTHGI
jgi:hypothetical protein